MTSPTVERCSVPWRRRSSSWGGLDVVVANAGIAEGARRMFRAMATENFERMLDVNLYGVDPQVDAALPEIVRRGGATSSSSPSIYAFVNGVGICALRHEQGRASSSSVARCASNWFRTAPAPASPISASSTPTWSTRASTRTPWPSAIPPLPKVLQKRLTPAVAGEATCRGIERRAAAHHPPPPLDRASSILPAPHQPRCSTSRWSATPTPRPPYATRLAWQPTSSRGRPDGFMRQPGVTAKCFQCP